MDASIQFIDEFQDMLSGLSGSGISPQVLEFLDEAGRRENQKKDEEGGAARGDDSWGSVLVLSAALGVPGICSQILASHPAAAGVLEAGRSALHFAPDAATVGALVAGGVSVKGLGPDGDGPLHRSEGKGREWAKALIEAGADPSAPDEHGRTPLHQAKSLEVAEELLAAGADPKARDELGLTPAESSSFARQAIEERQEEKAAEKESEREAEEPEKKGKERSARLEL